MITYDAAQYSDVDADGSDVAAPVARGENSMKSLAMRTLW